VEIDPDVANETATAPDGTGTTTTVTTLARSVLGVSAIDRPGLLHDISQGLNRLRVQLLHCEASVVANRSVSIWRLQNMDQRTTRDEIRTVIESLLSPLSVRVTQLQIQTLSTV
jgi:UTP:GlnB (protein PII) uridylyltransferase